MKGWDRALSRSGSTHVFWIETQEKTAGELADIESDLIEILNPRGNVQLPKPPQEAHPRTLDVIHAVRHEINKNRRQSGD